LEIRYNETFQDISGFMRFVEQTVFWLIEGARAILEMPFSKRFLAAGGKKSNVYRQIEEL